MSEYEAYHLLHQLLSTFGNADETLGEEKFESIIKGSSPFSPLSFSIHECLKNLQESAELAGGDKSQIQKTYESLKTRNAKNLDPMVAVLSRIAKNKELKDALEQHCMAHISSPSCVDSAISSGNSQSIIASGASGISLENVSQVRKMLQEQADNYVPPATISDAVLEGTSSQPSSFSIDPIWIHERQYQSQDYVLNPDISPVSGPLGNLPEESQKTALVTDLLYVMMGVEGEFIHPQPVVNRHAPREFLIDSSVEPHLRETVKQILPLCSNYSLVSRFVHEKSLCEQGLVNHAVAAAMKELLKEYTLLITQLETQSLSSGGGLTLQSLFYHVHPVMETMENLASVANSINQAKSRGAGVLSYLHERASLTSGQRAAKELLYLAKAAAVPYMQMLEKWIYKGVIDDPYAEFLIEDNEIRKRNELTGDAESEYSDDYWGKRYTVCRDRVPSFLKDISDKILRSGKYLNVIQQCGDGIKYPKAEELTYDLEATRLKTSIMNAYNFASKTLLQLLLKEKDLMGRLRSVKHYFLLDQGDFIAQFMDLAHLELQEKISDIDVTRLQCLLEMALRSFSATADHYKDDVKLKLFTCDLESLMLRIVCIDAQGRKDWHLEKNMALTGWEAFSFDYRVQWPVSLVINVKALACYQMIFRHLFYLKHIENLLLRVWTLQKQTRHFASRAAQSYTSTFALRHKMLRFIQTMEYFIMLEVLEPSWHNFLDKMESVDNIDDVLKHHMDFLTTCLKDCMLTSPDLLHTINQLLKTCLNFAMFVKHMYGLSIDAELGHLETDISSSTCALNASDEEGEGEMDSGSEGESFEENVHRFDLKFSGLLLGLLEKIVVVERGRQSENVASLLFRLDYNGFYIGQIRRRTMGPSQIPFTAIS